MWIETNTDTVKINFVAEMCTSGGIETYYTHSHMSMIWKFTFVYLFIYSFSSSSREKISKNIQSQFSYSTWTEVLHKMRL